MSIIRNRLYQFKQELLSNKDRAWYSHTNLLTAVDLLITDLDNLDESDWIRVNDEMPVERDSMFAKFKGTNKWKTGMFEKVSRNVLVTVEYDNGERHTEVAHPVMFFREVLNFEPDEWQAEAARDLAANPKVSIKSGQGVGKTGLEAAVFLWFITCFPYPRIVATAPTKQQLHDVLWSEISKWMSKSELLSMLLKWTKTYVYMVGNEKRWFGVARTATKPENMQGFHEDNMLFIVDEASGVADPIMEAILGTLSGSNNKLLLCGNPTRTSGTFYDSHTRDRALYKCHTVSSVDSSRTNKENIDSLIRKYGWDSNVVRVRVRGEFPNQEDDVFIPLSLIEQCSSKLLELDDAAGMQFVSLGVVF